MTGHAAGSGVSSPRRDVWTTELDAEGLLRVLTERGVDFVVIGGIAAVLHGSPRITQDLDICFDTSPGNLEALAGALQAVGAGLRGVDEEVPFRPDPSTLRRVVVLTLKTRLGDLDVLASPAGSPPYPELRARADRFDVGGFHIAVASIEDLIAMKHAAGRQKDHADVAELEVIRERRKRQSPA